MGAGILWAMRLAADPASLPAWLGLGCTAAAAALVMCLQQAHRRREAAAQQAHEEALRALEQAHSEEKAQMQAAALKQMESFRSHLSHSLRMPIAIIQGYAELLTGGVVTDPAVAAEYLEKIIQRTQYMTETMSRQVSAADVSDSHKLRYSRLELMALIRQTAADMKKAAADRSIRIQVLSAENQIFMEADAYLLNRMLFNLLENALKYMGRPGVVTIRAQRKDQHVLIVVQDDGLGLSAQQVPHIFQANYQGSNHTSGQGYGLYLVKRTVENHGGTVSAQSAPGQGMGIFITLPLRPASNPAPS